MSRERKELHLAVESLVEESRLSWKFMIFTALSSMIATLGLVMDNVTILIGAMLIAPLLIPVISLSIGVGAGSIKLIGHSIKSLFLGLAIAILSAMGMAMLTSKTLVSIEIFETFTDSATYSIVAFLAGIVAVYSWLKPNTVHILPGATIAVALIPPIAFTGIILASPETSMLTDLLQLIFVNLAGIFFGGLMTFLIFAIVSKRPTEEVGKQVDSEAEKEVEKKSN